MVPFCFAGKFATAKAFCLTVGVAAVFSVHAHGTDNSGTISTGLTVAFPGTSVTFPGKAKACGSGRATKILSGDRLLLKNGQTVSLAEIKAPEFWSPGAPYKSWPHSWQAKAALEAAAINSQLNLFCYRKQKNALGDLVAHIRTGTGTWLQYELVSNGHAYFMPHHHQPVLAAQLHGAEAEARTKKRGLWAIDGLSAVQATSEQLHPGWFQIVTGKILSEKRRKNGVYLNFGDDWSRDFTIEIPKRLYRQFNAKSDGTLGLEGQYVEVRGWVEWAGGPKIILEYASQLTVALPVPAQSR